VHIGADEQLPCHLTSTNERVAELCRQHIHLNRHVQAEVTGPRYCPSLESKIIRFPQVTSHQVWIEPEGFSSDEYYPQGISMTFPADIQLRILQQIPGLENVEVSVECVRLCRTCCADDARWLRCSI
jgi:tRNA uridine 5-carboxymethylaminomethyl modification enzyme